jgi:hypothetical protein
VINNYNSRTVGPNEPSGVWTPPRLGGGTPPPAWVPTDKSGLLYWFKSDAGVTESSGLVSAWLDQSGNTRNASQGTGALQPSYTASVQAGKPGISFPSGKFLTFGSDVLATEGSPNSLVVVAQPNSPGGTWFQTMVTVNTDQASGQYTAVFSNDASYSDVCWGFLIGTARAMRQAPGSFVSQTTSFVLNYNGGSVTSNGSYAPYRNNTSLTPAAGGTASVTSGLNKLGAWWDGSLNLTGYLFEIFAYSSELTAPELADVETYVSGRWGI